MKYIKFFLLVMTAVLTTSLKERPSEDSPLIVILLGPPGAGKGTHAQPLSDQLQIPHISTGELFRKHLQDETAFGKKAKTYIDEGKLVPDEIVLEMVFSRISQEDCKSGYILDGFPRTLYQAKRLQQKIKPGSNIVTIHFTVPDSVLIKRITGRLLCKQCGVPFHEVYAKPKKENSCDHCNAPLYKRTDDQEEVIRKRLEVYHQTHKPLLDFYDLNDVLYDVNSAKSPEEVFEELIQTIDSIFLSLNEQKNEKMMLAEKSP